MGNGALPIVKFSNGNHCDVFWITIRASAVCAPPFMLQGLVHAYTPLVSWLGLGLILGRWLPESLPNRLGRLLYWVGVPVQILALTRHTDFSQAIAPATVVTLLVLLVGATIGWLTVQGLDRWHPPWWPMVSPEQQRHRDGSFLLAAMLGNVGFIGLSLAPDLITAPFWGWMVFYSVAHNLAGTYGAGVVVASLFGRSHIHKSGWGHLLHLLTVPSLWACLLGLCIHNWTLPTIVEGSLQNGLSIVIPGALLLGGLRLGRLSGTHSLRQALPPVAIKMVLLPLLTGLALTLIGLQGDGRLALVLQSGMPSALGGLILAEEYDLDRDLSASAILLSTGLLLVTIPIWLLLFGPEGCFQTELGSI
jgi:malate permease and related proteins